MEERVFRGPLPDQIRSTLEFLKNVGGELVTKVSDQAEAKRIFAYPFQAMEEAIVNAVYHRGYDGPPEPVKVYVYPDRMEIISYPGPVAGVKREQLLPGQPGPVAPARNRRIGEFLKELRLAEVRGTGIPKIQRTMRGNGSPEPSFDFDDDRTHYRTTLPVHPNYLLTVMLADLFEMRDRTKGSKTEELIKKMVAGFSGSEQKKQTMLSYYKSLLRYFDKQLEDRNQPGEKELMGSNKIAKIIDHIKNS